MTARDKFPIGLVFVSINYVASGSHSYDKSLITSKLKCIISISEAFRDPQQTNARSTRKS